MKAGDVIKFLPEWSDSEDDGEFVILSMKGDRMDVQTITHCQDFAIKPINTVLCAWAYTVKEAA